MKQVFVGVDVSKDKFDFRIIDHKSRNLLGPRTYPMDIVGMTKFKEDLDEIAKKTKAVPIVGCENTGIYHVPFFDFCDRNKIPIQVFNSIVLTKYHRSRIRKARNDRIDTEAIATALLIEGVVVNQDLSDDVKALRELSRMRYRTQKKMTTCKVQVTRSIDIICRGYTKCFSNIFSTNSVAVIEKNFQLTRLFKQSEEELAKTLKKAGHPNPVKKAAQIRNVFDKAVVPEAMVEPCVFEIKLVLKQFRLLEEQLGKIEARMASFVEKMDTKIKTIPGIGSVTAAVVLGEIGSIERFSNPSKLVAFAGLDPSAKDSGKFKNPTRRISKRGSPYLRHALYIAAVSASVHNPVCKQFAERLKAKDKKGKVVIVAVARKLLTIIYSVLKNDREFQVPKHLLRTAAE